MCGWRAGKSSALQPEPVLASSPAHRAGAGLGHLDTEANNKPSTLVKNRRERRKKTEKANTRSLFLFFSLRQWRGSSSSWLPLLPLRQPTTTALHARPRWAGGKPYFYPLLLFTPCSLSLWMQLVELFSGQWKKHDFTSQKAIINARLDMALVSR
jgi:hypothetical protein